MPTKGEKLNFYIEVDGEYIPISDMQEVTFEEAEEKMIELNYTKVVRCKDCRFYEPHTEDEDLTVEENIKLADILRLYSLTGVCDRLGVYVKADDYCSSRERREDAKL